MNPIILHLDMNSYFASVEQQANPFLRGKPIAVVGHKKRTIVLAASIEAKRFGVKTGMMVHEAKLQCPSILLIPADGGKYLDIHERFLAILREYAERVEVFSIDEAFLDLTREAGTWDAAVEIGRTVKERFQQEIGERILCSIGIAPNKLLAKLGSDLKKPDGLTVIRPEDISDVLKRIKLQDFCGIGPRFGIALEGLGIRTVEELGAYPETLLRAKFGILGHVLHEMGHGRGSAFVSAFDAPDEVRSVGHSYTLPKDTTSVPEIRSVLLWLSEKVARRLRRRNLEGKVIALTVRQSDFSHLHGSADAHHYLSDGLALFRRAEALFQKLAWTKPVRLLGVSVSGVRPQVRQLSFFKDEDRRRSLLNAIDAVNDQFGDWTVVRALALPSVSHQSTFGGFHWKGME